ncbi:YciI family protein [Nocardia farcinica]|uniref:YciI family protein n=1 Tax=Nocardia farcinica TaxID=37329 RepID=UPI000A3D425D|nr:YciI family protein [Nocardia farcinica]MBF6253688.1 YciI family protein [Nocardia farcinica]MBF6258443.1 YciI family protein [Nocardia farcinica]MBF6265763.1 YciI family protein [Nocardia farcinica]MBF6270971.1 YciI family protein [Nocardia farcinica]MBF6284238.1 YciI family protein [Nocardia farcinica]
MKYMLIMRATDEAIEAAKQIPFEQIIEDMGKFNESLMKAGVLLGGEGLREPEEGFVVDFSADPPLVTDGPYGETKELFGGFWLLDVASKEEAVEWAKRVPLGPGSKIEVRRVTEPEDFPQDNEWVQKQTAWREELGTGTGTA